MGKRYKNIFYVFIATIFLAACGGNEEQVEKQTTNKLQVVTTFSIIDDIVNNVGGERVETHSMVPIGTDPHEYRPLPLDIQKATEADIIFYNGLNLEEGDGWFQGLIENVGKNPNQVILTTEGVEPKYLTAKDGSEDEINPHAFLDVNVGMIMVENVRDALVKIDPDYKNVYEKNATNYLEELKKIDKEYVEKIANIPEDNRILITSERAYQYMTDRYGLDAGYLWEIDTDEQGTPEQITSLIKLIKEKQVPALFVESNVDPRPMETVSKETGVPIADKLFSDELGKPGEEGDTYIKFLRYNIEKIYEHLK